MKQLLMSGTAFTPTKIVCIGRNYVGHIRELQNEVPEQPVIFIKPNSAISEQLHTPADEEVHYEGEITFMIQGGEIAAVGFGLDLTKRRLQGELKAKGLPWERAKAFDGAAVFSEFVPFSGDTHDLGLELHINGTLIQAGGHELMITKPDVILAEVKRTFTLEDGDLVMTGTPAGVGPLRTGDRYLGRIINGDRVLVEGRWEVQ